jgi:hypothetical protein
MRMKKMTPYKWREKHPRCEFCHWLKLEVVKVDSMADFYKCLVKDKIINFPDMPRPWCRCYKVKLDPVIKEDFPNA